MNVHGDLGYDDNKSLNRKKSATSGITGKWLGKLKDDDDYVLRRTMEDSIGGIVTSKDEKSNVSDLQPDIGQLKDDINNESIIPLNADVNYNTEAYDDKTNQG